MQGNDGAGPGVPTAEEHTKLGGGDSWPSDTGASSRALPPRDRYRLRRAGLQAQEAALRAQLAQHHVEALTLELERRYGLLGRETSVDARYGRIVELPDPRASIPSSQS